MIDDIEESDLYNEEDPDADDGTPDYYLCYCCGYSCAKNPGGWGCPKCGVIMSEESF